MELAVEVEITGNGTFAGAKSNIGTYSVTEESTPVIPSDSSGGVGGITFDAVDDPSRFGSVMLMNDEVTLTDGDRGTVVGKINSITSNDRILTVSADSRLGLLVGNRRAGMVDGTFEDAIRYYLGLAGITTGIAVHESLSDLPVLAPGFDADLWVKIKELLVIYGAEISVVRGNITVRPVRERRALEINNISESWTVANGELAKTVEVAYYNPRKVTSGLLYPAGGWNEDVSIQSVDAEETLTVNLPIDGWITSLEQPQVVDYVSRDNTNSVYSVMGSDGKPITASQWRATGGALTVSIGEDGSSIDVNIVGASGASKKLAPFRIAATAGSSNTYSSLRIRGTGLLYNRQTVTVPTGAGDLANADDAATVDNKYVRTMSQAYDIAAAVAGAYSSPSRTLSISKADINKPNSSDFSYNFVTFGQNDAFFESLNFEKFSDFDAFYVGKTFGEYDDFWYQQVKDDFDFQTFGNASGARVQFRRNMYRIRSTTTTESNVSYTAEADTTFGDWDANNTNTLVPITKNLLTNPSFEAAGEQLEVRRNYAQNPALDTNTTNRWGGSGAAWSNVGRVAVDNHPLGIPYAYQRNKTEEASPGGLYYNARDIEATVPRTYSLWLRAVQGTGDFRIRVERYPTVSGGSAQTINGPVVTVGPEWQRISINAPYGGPDLSRHVLTVYSNSGSMTGAVQLQATGMLIEDSTSPVAGEYFDGTRTPDIDLTPVWDGEVGASRSSLQRSLTANYEGFRSQKWAASGNYSMYVPELAEIAGAPLAFLDAADTTSAALSTSGFDPVTCYAIATVSVGTAVNAQIASYGAYSTTTNSSIGGMVLRTGGSATVNNPQNRAQGTDGTIYFGVAGPMVLDQPTPVAFWFAGTHFGAQTQGAAGVTTGTDVGSGLISSPRLRLGTVVQGRTPIAAVAYSGLHTSAVTRNSIMGWFKTRYNYVFLDNQTFIITPRHSGQKVYFNDQEIVTQAGVPVRVTGTGPVGLGTGWWDQAGVFNGGYGASWFDGNSAEPAGYTFLWDGTPNASTSTMYDGHPALTFAEFDRLFDGKTFSDFAIAPLLNVNPEYDR